VNGDTASNLIQQNLWLPIEVFYVVNSEV